MISIDKAVELSKNKENISNGGSKCFDFGDTVLVKYTVLTKYLKDGAHAREKSEEIMKSINEKADNGVNTPKHLAIKRTVEGVCDVCYVLQQKSPGINCEDTYKCGVSFEDMCDDLNFILNIPFEHYKKFIYDACQLYEMGHEAKNKNLFYDSNSGFWFIDFLDNNYNDKFDKNDITKIFKVIKYKIPNFIQFASSMEYDVELTSEQIKKRELLRYGIKTKRLLAIRDVLPVFRKYEKFYLADETDDYKRYLMKEKIFDTDLFKLDENDYKIFDELYEIIMEGLINKVVNEGIEFWSISINDIRIDSGLFNLGKMWGLHKDCTVKRKDFDDIYNYNYEVKQELENKILLDLISNLRKVNKNDNVINFLNDAGKHLHIESNITKK